MARNPAQCGSAAALRTLGLQKGNFWGAVAAGGRDRIQGHPQFGLRALSTTATSELTLRWRRLGSLPSAQAGHAMIAAIPEAAKGSVMRRALMIQLAGGKATAIGHDLSSQPIKVSGSLRGSQVAAVPGHPGQAYILEATRSMIPGSTRFVDLNKGEAKKLKHACQLQKFKTAVVNGIVFCLGEDFHDIITEGPLSVMRYDPSGSTDYAKVSASGDLPPRKLEALTAVDHELFAFIKNDENTLDTYIFNTETNEWTFGEVAGDLPQAVQNCSATPVRMEDGSSKIVLVGGTLFAENLLLRAHSDKAVVLDTDTLTWNTTTSRGAKPTGRAEHAAVAVAPGKIILSGGKNEIQSFKDVYQLELQ